MPPVVSPKAAFDTLFSNFTPPSSAADQAARDFALRSRKSILDLVGTKLQRLASDPQLGNADHQRLPRPYDGIRALELQISPRPPPAPATCHPPTAPGADPPLAAAQAR